MAKRKNKHIAETNGTPWNIATNNSFWIPTSGTQGGLTPRQVGGRYYGQIEVHSNTDVEVFITDFSGSFNKTAGTNFPFSIAANPTPFSQRCGWDSTPATRVGRHTYGFHSPTSTQGTASFPYGGVCDWNSPDKGADIKSGIIGKLADLPYRVVEHTTYYEVISKVDILGFGWYPQGPTEDVSINSETFEFTSEEITRYYFPMAVFKTSSNKFISCDDPGHSAQLCNNNSFRDVRNLYGSSMRTDGQGLIYDTQFRNINRSESPSKNKKTKKTRSKK